MNQEDNTSTIDNIHCFETNQKKQTEHVLSKLQQVFHDGYRPARGTEPYDFTLKNECKAYRLVNCFGHMFNLKNQQLNDYQFGPYPIYSAFNEIDKDPDNKASQRMLDFIKEIGLKVEECAPDKLIDDFKSWKIALYFGKYNNNQKDFHYLLEEAPGLWSSKIGFEPCLEHIYQTTPPSCYRDLISTDPIIYDFYGTYKITNPNADANNRYLKKLKRCNNTAFKSTSLKHHIVEDARNYSFEKILDEFLYCEI